MPLPSAFVALCERLSGKLAARERFDASHALKAGLYGRPSRDAMASAEAMVQEADPLCRLVAFEVAGKARPEAQFKCKLRARFWFEDSNGNFFSLSDSIYAPSPSHYEAGRETLYNWLAAEKVSILRDASGQWSWGSARSASPDVVVVRHVSKCLRWMPVELDEALDLVVRHRLTQLTPRLAARRAAIERTATPSSGLVRRTFAQSETARLSEFLPDESLPLALALSENQELRRQLAEAKMDRSASPSADPQAPTHRKASRL
jgi:hypothetical protein